MYVRDARGGMRPVIVDSNQVPYSQQKPGPGWPHGSTTTRGRAWEYDGFAVNQASVRNDKWSREIPTPSMYDTLPRGDIGGPPRLSESRERFDDNASIVSEPMFAYSRGRLESRCNTPSGRASVHSDGSVCGSRSHLIPQPEAAWRHSQARLVERRSSLGRHTPSYVNGYGHASRTAGRTPSPPLQYRGGYGSLGSSYGQMNQRLNTPIPGRQVRAIDPGIRQADTQGRQYYINMNLNPALAQPSATQFDHMLDYSRNGSRMSLGYGRGSQYEDGNGYMDEGFHKSRINVVDYESRMPSRPSSRSVSVLYLDNDRDSGSQRYGGRSVLDDDLLVEESYVVNLNKVARPRPTRQMSAYMRGSRGRLNGDEKVEFDFELYGLGGGTSRPVSRGGVMYNTGREMSVRPASAAASEYMWQNTSGRLSSNFYAGPEPRFTINLNDSLLMDYLPNESQEVRSVSRNSRPASSVRRSRQSRAHGSRSYDEEKNERESFSRQGRQTPKEEHDEVKESMEQDRRQLEEEIEEERRQIRREIEKMKEERQKEDEKRRKKEEERKRNDRERRREDEEKRIEREEIRREEEEKKREEEERRREEEEIRREEEVRRREEEVRRREKQERRREEQERHRVNAGRLTANEEKPLELERRRRRQREEVARRR